MFTESRNRLVSAIHWTIWNLLSKIVMNGPMVCKLFVCEGKGVGGGGVGGGGGGGDGGSRLY